MKHKLFLVMGVMLLICAIIITGCVTARSVAEQPDNSMYYELLGYDMDVVDKDPQQFSGKYADFLLSYKTALSGDFDKAIEMMRDLLAKDPDSVYLKNELGALYLQKGDYERALAVLQEAAAHTPVDPETLFLLGPAYHGLNRISDAIAIYERLIVMPEGKSNPEVFFILAKLYLDSGKELEAKQRIMEGAKAFPDNFGFAFVLAEIYMQTKDYPRAEEAYKKTLRLEPYFFEARFALANLYRETKRLNEAINAYSDILAYEPENIPAMLGIALAYRDAKRPVAAHDVMGTLAVRALSDSLVMSDIYGIYMDKGNYADALYLLEGILNVNPSNMDLRYMAAMCEQNTGNLEAAVKHYALIESDSKYYANAAIQRALLLNQLGRAKETALVLKQAIKDLPKNDELYYIAGLFAFEQKQYPQAVTYLEKAIELSPKNIQYLLQLGMFLEKVGRQDDAIAYMRKVLETDPANAPALNYIGYTYADQGRNLDEAEALILKALSVSPGDGYIVDSLGWVYYKKGEYELALQHLNQAREMQPNDPVISEHLGDVYVKLNQPEKAAVYYKQALELDESKERYDIVMQKLNAIKP